MKRNKCLTGYVVLFMIGSFSAGLTLLLTAIVMQHDPPDEDGSSSSRRGGRGRGGTTDPTKQSLRSFATVNVRRQLLNQSLPFVQDVVCAGCRSHKVQLSSKSDQQEQDAPTSSFRCGDVLRLDLLNSVTAAASASTATTNSTSASASLRQMTARQRQELTKACRAHCYECPATRKRYWRYDRVLVAPRGGSNPIATLQSLSVPTKHRIPDPVLRADDSNLNEYLHLRMHRSIYYFDYNPSVVRLPRPNNKSDKDRTIDDPFQGAEYVASFRVSTVHSCFQPDVRKYMKRNHDEPTDYVGIALLNHRLEVMQDAVFDLRSSLQGQGQVQDVRLFVLHNQLYVSSYDWIAPIWIGIAGFSTHSDPPPSGYRPVRRVFGNQEHHNLDVWIRAYVSCAGCASKQGAASTSATTKSCGKNFNYFAVSNDPTKALVEVWPSPPHQVRTVDLQSHCQRDAVPERFVDDSSTAASSSSRVSTFATVEELHFSEWDTSDPRRLLTRGRGGACCVEMQVRDPVSGELQQALVGIQHVKTPSQKSPSGPIIENHYLSRFYAFETTPPYRIISQSGYFCLGFGTDMNALNEATRWRSLMLGERFEDCPRIHFVSGITLKSQDPSTLIVAYGINDCVSAIAQLPVQAVQQLLYRGPAMLQRSKSTVNTAQA